MFKNYFCDGSTFGANANRHKMVWKKNARRYQAATEQKFRELFAEIDRLNTAEQSQYGNKDMEEIRGNSQPVSREVIATADTKRIKCKALTLKRKIEHASGQYQSHK